MTNRIHKALSTLVSVGLIVALLAGCGGRSSSVTGPTGSGGGAGESTAVVHGQVATMQSGALNETTTVVVLRTVLGIGLAEAQSAAGTPLAGATVMLVGVGGTTFSATTKTDANGNFIFTNVPPGTYTVVVNGFTVVASGLPITVGAGDEGTIVGRVTSTSVAGAVSVVAQDVGDVLQNDAQLGHAINLARASNRDLLEVIALREQGLGWGEIAHRLGVHPSVIGLGRSNLSDADLAEGREHAKGHGGGGGKDKDKDKGKGPKA